MIVPRRVVLYETGDGWWWKAQGANWRTIEVATRPRARRQTAENDVRKRWPDVEITTSGGAR